MTCSGSICSVPGGRGAHLPWWLIAVTYRWGQGLRVALPAGWLARGATAPCFAGGCLVPCVPSSVLLQVLGQKLLCETTLTSTVYSASGDSSSSIKSEMSMCLLFRDRWFQALPALEPARGHLSTQTAETSPGKDLRVGTRLGAQSAQTRGQPPGAAHTHLPPSSLTRWGDRPHPHFTDGETEVGSQDGSQPHSLRGDPAKVPAAATHSPRLQVGELGPAGGALPGEAWTGQRPRPSAPACPAARGPSSAHQPLSRPPGRLGGGRGSEPSSAGASLAPGRPAQAHVSCLSSGPGPHIPEGRGSAASSGVRP